MKKEQKYCLLVGMLIGALLQFAYLRGSAPALLAALFVIGATLVRDTDMGNHKTQKLDKKCGCSLCSAEIPINKSLCDACDQHGCKFDRSVCLPAVANHPQSPA